MTIKTAGQRYNSGSRKECPEPAPTDPGRPHSRQSRKEAEAIMAEAQSTVTPSPNFVPHCPVCGDVSATVTQLPAPVKDVAQLLYLCPQDHGWIIKWVAG